ncbi:P-loop containing nucleoside triphosphate hydrolase protein [Fennellomyces sp. T-0311]|nr:P-loop containing nucleoside triphosphate hydrolase protein [Fennellomyces sp. T-0311]
MAEKHPPEDSQPSASITEVTDEVVSATVPKKVRRKPAKVATTEGSGDATDSSKPKRKSTRKSKAEKASENTKTLDTYFIQPKKLDVDENVHSGPEERELQSESNHLGHTNHALVPVDPVDLRSVDQQTTTPKPQQALDNQPLSKSNQKDDTPEQTPDSPAVDPLVIQQSVAAQNTNENSPSDLPEVDMEPNIAKARTNVVAAPPQRPPIPQKFSSPPIWVNKHSPSHISMVAGNRGAIDQLDAWLKNWHTNVSANGKATAKKRGRAIGDYKSALISGPPGIGKTTVAHLIAKSNGYSAIEYNASDVRSRKLIQDKISHMVDNRTMTEFYQAYASKEFDKKKVVLIMDEVDGMSTGDHGGAQELIALIRITKVPIICICNDIQSKKVQSLKNICLDTRFVNKFTVKETQSVVQMVMQIAERENFHISESTLRSVMRSSHNDIRNTINMLQVQNLLRDGLEYEEAQSIIDRQRKDREMNIFEIVNILFSDTTWERKTLEEIADLCYQEQHLAPEMVFENYLKFKPSKAETVKVEAHGEKVDTGLKLAAEAAESIADGDLMESMMYSSHRHMNDPLLPAARYMFGSVRPAALLHGKSPGYRLGFPVSLGKGSTAMKCAHQVTELRNNMRLTTYATRHEIRREYIPTLNDRISSTLMEKRYDDAIDIMDTYYLNRMSLDILNDFDLSLDPGNKPMMKVPASTKRAFTLKYNKLPHPIGMAPKDGTDIIKKKTSSLYATNYLGEELALDGLSDEDAEYHFDVV